METTPTTQVADPQSSQNTTQPAAITRPTHIFGPPQELQDIIFEYAYEKPVDAQLVSHYQRAAKDSIAGQFASPWKTKTDDWLVCKRWFVAAARAYARSHVVPMHAVSLSASGVLHAFGRDFSTGDVPLRGVRPEAFKEICSLTVEVFFLYSAPLLSVLTRQNVDEDDADLGLSSIVETLMAFRGLRNIIVCPEPSSDGSVDDDDHAVRCIQIHELLQCVVDRPGTQKTIDEDDSMYCFTCDDAVPPIYAGSEVCGNNHVAVKNAVLQENYKDSPPLDSASIFPGLSSVRHSGSFETSEAEEHGEEGIAIEENRTGVAQKSVKLLNSKTRPQAKSRKRKPPLSAMLEASVRKEREALAPESIQYTGRNQGSNQDMQRLKAFASCEEMLWDLRRQMHKQMLKRSCRKITVKRRASIAMLVPQERPPNKTSSPSVPGL